MQRNLNFHFVKRNRERNEIMLDILKIIYTNNGEVGITKLIFSSNTNYKFIKSLTQDLSNAGLIKTYQNKAKHTFTITDKGKDIIERYYNINFLNLRHLQILVDLLIL
ncbi:hypothetical protein [Thermoplasma volcanium GSS1]|uniref:ArnR1-like winged helix-turn-helix domain-containing protein n=1 Tax=Thermoplasma volcanium (strain ATCC 51530 / DSM 4299 / JCM 9571 / NBRC 15438 / GSS1) TaxID=273116 RepID=Q979E7_THEVO|nr:hypothetical protein [Thermoplasma volcanium GSS1]